MDELEDEILDEIKLFEEKELLQQEEEKDGEKKIVRSGENIFNNENIDIITNEIKHLLKQRKQQQQQRQRQQRQQQLLQDVDAIAIKDSNKKLDNNDIFSDKFVDEYENVFRSANKELRQQQQQQQQLSRGFIDLNTNKDIGKVNNYGSKIQLLQSLNTDKMNQIANNDEAGIFPINNVDELIDIVSRIVAADERSNGLLEHSAKK